jgi:hypothetical protein
MDNKKLPTLLGWKGKISTNREHYLSVSSFINFFLILLVNKQMHDLTNLHQCFINITFTTTTRFFLFLLYPLFFTPYPNWRYYALLVNLEHIPIQILLLLVPLFWTRNIYQLVNFEDSNSNKIVYASLQMLTTFLLFLNFLTYSGIHVINVY